MLCHESHVEIRADFDSPQVHVEDLFPFLEFGQFHMDLTVKTSGTHQRFVQNIGAVGRRQDDHARIGAETVHFSQQLVQGVFPLIVGRESTVFGPCASDGIDLVNKDNARGLLLCLAEQVTDAGCTHTHKHFYEIGA